MRYLPKSPADREAMLRGVQQHIVVEYAREH